ncbi:uncharacterized protein LOC120716363 [Simochromis diagramma]|uniref:uncharacterized protein LOC120716363 n=1 Tax=Simochromis diagramma TaxID=43689 RepID=UPI001A7EBE3F|nr:uncharacterized protein LOC120716363 [Simochromis diagramma]
MQHASTGGHMMNMRGVKERGTLDQFVVHQATAEADMVTAAEVTHVYHTVKHGLSYNSGDCALKLTVRTLNDSSIAKNMSFGRTKAEAVVTDVLSPKAIEEVIKKLKSGATPLPFSLHTDASNKGNRKNVTTFVDLYSIMECFLKRLFQRRDDGFYGYLTRQKLQRLSPSDADGARQEFTAFLDTAISYVRKRFDFSEENWLFHLQPVSLASGKISFDDMEKIIERLHLAGR